MKKWQKVEDVELLRKLGELGIVKLLPNTGVDGCCEVDFYGDKYHKYKQTLCPFAVLADGDGRLFEYEVDMEYDNPFDVHVFVYRREYSE